MEFNYIHGWHTYRKQHPRARAIPASAPWGGGEFDLGLGLGTEILELNEVIGVSAWLLITARQELQFDRVVITGIPGKHGPLQLVTPDVRQHYQFPAGDGYRLRLC